MTATQTIYIESGPTGIVREVVKEVETIGNAPAPDHRLDNLYEREAKVGGREREVGHREEVVGKREVDAARREQWIMDQLVKLGSDKVVEEEVVYDAPRKKKVPPRSH
ncbi:hypothetical protein FS842_002238 [Serendipita sp. 407]|nr:hypothetical protein FS842_002238 [Serendipita sp. 407]